MTESEFLSPAEIRDLTGRARVDAQCECLTEFGVPFRLAGRRPLVSRFHVREWLSGRTVTPSRGINLSAVR
jgi:hypothetical protein